MGKATKQSSKTPPSTTQPVNTAEDSLLQSDITLQSPDEQAVNEPSPQQYMRAPRRRRHEIEPITLDTAFIRNLPKVNFALLLALLMREKGRVQLTQRELDAADDERLNVMFALSLDGKALEVSLVSTQSGIIRSPEANLWAQPGENLQQLQPGAIQSQTILSPPPYSSPPLPPVADESARREQAAAIVRDWQQQHPDGSGPEAGRIVEMPNPQQPQQARKAPEMVFPFQVGANPQDAKSVSLSEIQTDLQRDRQIQQQEQIAAARVEGGSA